MKGGMMDTKKRGTNLNREKLEFYLPDTFKGLTKDYILECIFDEDIQKSWSPSIGDIIVGETGNIFVVSGEHRLVDELGSTLYFFGGGLCNRDGGHILDSTFCYTMNKSGDWYEYTADGIEIVDNLYHSAFSEFRYVPYPHEHPKLKEVYG